MNSAQQAIVVRALNQAARAETDYEAALAYALASEIIEDMETVDHVTEEYLTMTDSIQHRLSAQVADARLVPDSAKDGEYDAMYDLIDTVEELLNTYDLDAEDSDWLGGVVFLRGSLPEGFEVVGPYRDMDEAADAHDEDGWFIALTKPTEAEAEEPEEIKLTVELDDGGEASWVLDVETWNAVEKVLGRPDSQRP